MNLTRITYSGRKAYRDKLSNNTWEPGDIKLVTDDAAKKLLRFAEFARAKEKAGPAKAEAPPAGDPAKADQANANPTDAELEAALIKTQEADRAKEQDRQQLEAMLLTVESMEKGALEEYARKYDVELNKRTGVAKLRAEVATLVEQFGVR